MARFFHYLSKRPVVSAPVSPKDEDMYNTTGHRTNAAGRRAWWVAAVTAVAIIVAGAFSTMPG
ncbi:hypothetical protein NGM37_03735, partial [Streptomyces sp. TRM76130]|nr:hypothetical protein [Streptomyces sp. TRM76130]